MNPYIRRQLTLALEALDADNLPFAADATRRALDALSDAVPMTDDDFTDADLERLFGDVEEIE